mmetsp:Transcript_23393/g.35037  ORF Transcript_23393/g.35037 Transcript_23393/m.35037 type:complete len:489 (+) Transcript_23393:212-1678(+)
MRRLYKKFSGKEAPRYAPLDSNASGVNFTAFADNITDDAERLANHHFETLKRSNKRARSLSPDPRGSPNVVSPMHGSPDVSDFSASSVPSLNLRTSRNIENSVLSREKEKIEKRGPIIVDDRRRHSNSETTLTRITNDGLSDWTGASQMSVDFEFFDPSHNDTNDIALLLENYAEAGWRKHPLGNNNFDAKGMANTIIYQSQLNYDEGYARVGTIIRGDKGGKKGRTSEIEEEDADSEKSNNEKKDNGMLIGVVSMINLNRYKDELWVRQLKHFLLESTKELQVKDFISGLGGRKRLSSALSSSKTVLLIAERVMVGLPVQLSYSSLEAVFEEVEWAREDEQDDEIRKSWNWEKCIYMIKARSTITTVLKERTKPRKREIDQDVAQEVEREAPKCHGAIGAGELIYEYEEERILHEAAEFACMIQTQQQLEKGEGEVNVILIVSQQKLQKVRENLRKLADKATYKGSRKSKRRTRGEYKPRRNLKVTW